MFLKKCPKSRGEGACNKATPAPPINLQQPHRCSSALTPLVRAALTAQPPICYLQGLLCRNLGQGHTGRLGNVERQLILCYNNVVN